MSGRESGGSDRWRSSINLLDNRRRTHEMIIFETHPSVRKERLFVVLLLLLAEFTRDASFLGGNTSSVSVTISRTGIHHWHLHNQDTKSRNEA